MDIDILEQSIADYNYALLEMLLFDRTTRKNIKWGTDNYKSYGKGYEPHNEILPAHVTGIYGTVIQPRVSKNIKEQLHRTKDKAEVFTPSWICNVQNNLVDSAWFGREDVFNFPKGEGWEVQEENIVFPADKTWHDYVKAIRIEISCGEAPYLVSRYDAVSGKVIPVRNRIGILDRKLRVVFENTNNEQDWLKWAKKAYQSCYGYDYQGDNLLLARENMLCSLIEYMQEYFGHNPDLRDLQEVARIVSWNIWQMDGITLTAPYSEQEKSVVQLDLFGEEDPAVISVPCRVYDWSANRSIEFRSLFKE